MLSKKQLVAEETEDEDWPEDLLRLRDRFKQRYELEKENLKEVHQQEVAKLKEEHHKMLNGALGRARRRSSKEGDGVEIEIIKDRDNLKKTNAVLRHLVGELMKYFTQCEDELNNTLTDQLLKYAFDKSLSQIENDLGITENTNEQKRVHFTPNFNEFLEVLDNSNLTSLESKELSLDMKNELETCLEKLKSEANAILALSTNSRPNAEKLSMDVELPIGDDEGLNSEMEDMRRYVGGLESEKARLEGQLEMLLEKQKVMERDLRQARDKIAELIENGHKETVSEGYGEKSDQRDPILGELIFSVKVHFKFAFKLEKTGFLSQQFFQ